MDSLSLLYLLAAIFFVVAFAYSSVGLGGGSSYTALLAAFGFLTLAIPTISLVLNILVTSVGSYHFIRNGHGKLRLILPFLISSIPMAYVGGALQIPKTAFYFILLVSLIFVAFRIYFWKSVAFELNFNSTQKITLSLFAGGLLGLIAGIAGIGGGIFLVPLILILGLGSEKEAAACGAIFIWLNSTAGLISRIQFNTIDLTPYLPLFLSVMVGGWIGARLGATKLASDRMDKILGVIILIAIFLIGKKLFM